MRVTIVTAVALAAQMVIVLVACLMLLTVVGDVPENTESEIGNDGLEIDANCNPSATHNSLHGGNICPESNILEETYRY